MDNIEFLSLNDILEIHNEAIEIFGGSFDFYRDTKSKIKSILDQQYPHFGYDKYPTPLTQILFSGSVFIFLTLNIYMQGTFQLTFRGFATSGYYQKCYPRCCKPSVV